MEPNIRKRPERLRIRSLLRLDCEGHVYLQSMFQVIVQKRQVKSKIDRKTLGRQSDLQGLFSTIMGIVP